MRTVRVTTHDSLGHVVADYQTKIDKEAYSGLLANAEEDDQGTLICVRDCEVDGELGYRIIEL